MGGRGLSYDVFWAIVKLTSRKRGEGRDHAKLATAAESSEPLMLGNRLVSLDFEVDS
jgi:hypothetical protein